MDPKLTSKSFNPNIYGSEAGSNSGVDPPPKNWPHFGTHMVIKTLDGSSCKKYIISTSATMELPKNSE